MPLLHVQIGYSLEFLSKTTKFIMCDITLKAINDCIAWLLTMYVILRTLVNFIVEFYFNGDVDCVAIYTKLTALAGKCK